MQRPTFPEPLYPDTKAVCDRLDYIIQLLEAKPEAPPHLHLFDALRDYAERLLPGQANG